MHQYCFSRKKLRSVAISSEETGKPHHNALNVRDSTRVRQRLASVQTMNRKTRVFFAQLAAPGCCER
jgi:hypothetical protein